MPGLTPSQQSQNLWAWETDICILKKCPSVSNICPSVRTAVIPVFFMKFSEPQPPGEGTTIGIIIPFDIWGE